MKDVNLLTSNGVNVEESLELFGDMEMYDETLNDFLDMVDEKLAKLENFKVASDMPNYAIEVHSLKSDARYLGFAKLADVAYQSELKSKAGDQLFVMDNHPIVISEAKKMIVLAKKYLGKPVSPEEEAAANAPAPTPVAAPTLAPVAAPAPMPGVAPAPMPGVAPAPMPGVAPAPMPGVAPAPMPGVAPAPMPGVAPAPMPGVAPTPMPGVAPAPMPGVAPAPMPGVAPAPMPAQPAMPQVPGIDTILVVDDSNLVANFIKKIFDNRYHVHIASDGAKAIEFLNNSGNAIIKCCLLDLNMPNVNGYQVLEHFKQNGYFVKFPVAVISGVEDSASLDPIYSYPIVDILSKPFNERDVQRVIEKCLATYN